MYTKITDKQIKFVKDALNEKASWTDDEFFPDMLRLMAVNNGNQWVQHKRNPKWYPNGVEDIGWILEEIAEEMAGINGETWLWDTEEVFSMLDETVKTYASITDE